MSTRYAAFAGVVLYVAPGLAAAQTTCDILAANLRQDELIQGSAASQFAEHKRAICTQANKEWSNASGKSFNGSLNVPGYVDLVLGTSSNAQNWGSSHDRFCSLDEGTVASSQVASTRVRQASTQALATIANCAEELARLNASGLFGVLEVAERRDGFTIRVHNRTGGSSEWAVTGVSPTPTPAVFTCKEDLHKTSLTNRRTIKEASFTIVCDKDARTPIKVAVNTSEGALPVFSIEGLDDRLRALEERLAVVEGRAVPAGAVAWFESEGCPGGWAAYEQARGRTIVGAGNTQNRDQRNAVISQWRVGATGGEESHQLTVAEMPAHNHGFERAGNDANNNFYKGLGDISGGIKGTTATGGDQPHNNMPPFVALTPCVRR